MAALCVHSASSSCIRNLYGNNRNGQITVLYPIPSLTVVARRHKTGPRIKQIMLTQDVPKLGKKGEIVAVKPGHFRNHLLPKGMALRIPPGYTRHQMLIELGKFLAEEKRIKNEALDFAAMFEAAGTFKIFRKIRKDNTVYPCIKRDEIAKAFEEKIKRKVPPRMLRPPYIIEGGEFKISVKFHKEVFCTVKLLVEQKPPKPVTWFPLWISLMPNSSGDVWTAPWVEKRKKLNTPHLKQAVEDEESE